MTNKKIMGLPLVVWMGVAAGGLLLGLWLRHRGTGSSPGSIDAAVAGGGILPPSSGFDQNTLASLLGGRPVAAVGGPGVTSSPNPDGSVDFFDAAGNQIGSWLNVWNASQTPVYNVPSSGGSGAGNPQALTTPIYGPVIYEHFFNSDDETPLHPKTSNAFYTSGGQEVSIPYGSYPGQVVIR